MPVCGMLMLVPPESCACTVICPETTSGATVCGSLVKTKLATCACAKRPEESRHTKQTRRHSLSVTPFMKTIMPQNRRVQAQLPKICGNQFSPRPKTRSSSSREDFAAAFCSTGSGSGFGAGLSGSQEQARLRMCAVVLRGGSARSHALAQNVGGRTRAGRKAPCFQCVPVLWLRLPRAERCAPTIAPKRVRALTGRTGVPQRPTRSKRTIARSAVLFMRMPWPTLLARTGAVVLPPSRRDSLSFFGGIAKSAAFC